jgi:hypothetical protein
MTISVTGGLTSDGLFTGIGSKRFEYSNADKNAQFKNRPSSPFSASGGISSGSISGMNYTGGGVSASVSGPIGHHFSGSASVTGNVATVAGRTVAGGGGKFGIRAKM